MPDQLQQEIERKFADNNLVDECRVHVEMTGEGDEAGQPVLTLRDPVRDNEHSSQRS